MRRKPFSGRDRRTDARRTATFADKPTIRGDRIVLRPLEAQDDEITHFTGPVDLSCVR